MIQTALILLLACGAIVLGYRIEREDHFVKTYETAIENESLIHLQDAQVLAFLGKVLEISPQDAEIVLAQIQEMTSKALANTEASCKGNECHVDIDVPVLKELTLSLRYINQTEPIMVFSISRVNKEMFRIEVSAEATPKICVLAHFCGQIRNIYLKDGELCGSVIFNGLPILRDRCLPL